MRPEEIVDVVKTVFSSAELIGDPWAPKTWTVLGIDRDQFVGWQGHVVAFRDLDGLLRAIRITIEGQERHREKLRELEEKLLAMKP